MISFVIRCYFDNKTTALLLFKLFFQILLYQYNVVYSMTDGMYEYITTQEISSSDKS